MDKWEIISWAKSLYYKTIALISYVLHVLITYVYLVTFS